MVDGVSTQRRILMTVDAVGGVWQYAVGLGEQMKRSGNVVMFAGCGPRPSAEQMQEAEAIGSLVWLQTPPSWMAKSERDLDCFADEIACLAPANSISVLHLNEPSQAAALSLALPIVAVSHSCTTTWFRDVRRSKPPSAWDWHRKRMQAGIDRADIIVSPSVSHGAALRECYGAPARQVVVHNGVAAWTSVEQRQDFIFAAARWWDAGKNGSILDRAAERAVWPVVAAGPTQGPNGDRFSFKSAVTLGPIAHEHARRLAACCALFVSPSIYEPFGLAALEAASAGTPLVLADIPTYREIWGNAAVFFPPDDSDALAHSINLLAKDATLRQSLGEAALCRSRSFTLARQSAAMCATYDQAAALHARRAA